MKRLIWLVVGAAVGIVVARKLSARASGFTPRGLAGQLTHAASRAVAGVSDSIRGFGDDVRAGMAEREAELRHAMLLGEHQPNGHSDLDADAAARLAGDSDANWRSKD